MATRIKSNVFNTHSGFTLLEIMVSVAIISLVLVSIYRMHAQTIAMNYDARFYATAPFLAQWKISELENTTIETLTDDSGDFGDEHPGYRWTLVIEDVVSEPLGEAAKNLKKIDVTVLLDDDRLSYNVRTYRWMN
jgi:general secretion pathway protein I